MKEFLTAAVLIVLLLSCDRNMRIFSSPEKEMDEESPIENREFAVISINSVLVDYDIFIDGESVGKTPWNNKRVVAGLRKFLVKNEDKEIFSTDIELSSNDTVTIDIVCDYRSHCTGEIKIK